MSSLCVRRIENEGRIFVATRAAPADIASGISAALGVSLPVTAGHSERGDISALCFAPGEWLVLTGGIDRHRILATLEDSLAATVSHVTDVTSAKTGYEVRGDDARDLIAGLCPLDLDPAVFPPGRCARSLLVRVPVSVLYSDERPTYRLYVDRSLAAYAHNWLADAVALCGGDRSS